MDDAIKALERDLGASKRQQAKPAVAAPATEEPSSRARAGKRSTTGAPVATATPATPTTQRTSAPPAAEQTYNLGELGMVRGDTASRRPAIGTTVKLPGYLWPGSSSHTTTTCDVVAWANTINKYIVRAHDDAHHYAMPSAIVNKRMNALSHKRSK
jgi:hypothetical protein